MFLQVVFLLCSGISLLEASSCLSRTTDNGAVCVCNATYCDTVPPLANLPSGQYQLYSTSSSTPGFTSTTGTLASFSLSLSTVSVNSNKKFQTILGFGAAFTDSAGQNVLSLPAGAQQNFLQSLFGENGISFSLCRVPVGGTDFSSRFYTYCDTVDTTLASFALQQEDLTLKIPFIQQADQLRKSSVNGTLKLFASAWSAPGWMKTSGTAASGFLLTQYYQLWADYYIKFFDAYKQNNISFWGMTTQNEPIDGFFPEWISKINSMGWDSAWMSNWVGTNLGPTIRSSDYSDLKIILHDDQRLLLPILNALILSNDTVLQYADGVAVHWYLDSFISPDYLRYAATPKKDLFLIASEACNGNKASLGLEAAVELGSWSRGVNYLTDIFDDIEYNATGWVEWNMALNTSGGPTYIENVVDSSIIVNATAGEFYKQPMHYVLGHFSKFVVPGSIRLDTTVSAIGSLAGIRALAFQRPDNKIALVLYNSAIISQSVRLTMGGTTGAITLGASSLTTIIYTV